MLRIDFETRSELDVTKVGSHKYAGHPSTDVNCLRWSIDEGPVYLWHPFKGPRPIPELLRKAIYDDGHEVEAHNSMFEECIWKFVLVRKYGWPDIPVTSWVCSASRAAYAALPRALDKVGAVLNLEKQKDLEGKRIMLLCAKPRRKTKKHPEGGWHEEPSKLNQVFAYCKDDVLSERELSHKLPMLPAHEKEIWQMDQRMNRLGVYIDIEAVKSALYLIEEIGKKLLKELSEITDGKITTVNQHARFSKFLLSKNLSLPNLQAGTVAEALDSWHPKWDLSCKRVLEIKQALSKSSLKKYPGILKRICDDGRIRDILLYCGASTHRWSAQGLQVQNLPRGKVKDFETVIETMKLRDVETFEMLYPKPYETISGVLRGMICAPPGKVIRAFDYSAIEARLVFWLSGCEQGIADFSSTVEGYEPYKVMAADIFNTTWDKILKDSDERFVGKQTILGSGYGMGFIKFVSTCKSLGKVVSLELGERAIKRYRARYPEVPAYWKNTERAMIRAFLTGKPQTVGLVTFVKHKDYMTIDLPSGSQLFYWYPTYEELPNSWGGTSEKFCFEYWDSQKARWVRGDIWGGTIVENISQSVARDLMAPAFIALEKAGYTPLMSVHDELVTEDDKDFGSLDEMKKIILSSRPSWAKGLPLAVEGWQGPRYKK